MSAARIKIGILPRLFLAIALGAVVGFVAPECAIRAINCFSSTFGQFIRFFVPFIVLGLVTPAIAETGAGAGRMLLVTMGFAYASTLFSGGFAFCVSDALFPKILGSTLDAAANVKSFPAYFTLEIPPVMGITTALVSSFICGLAIVKLDSPVLKRACF